MADQEESLRKKLKLPQKQLQKLQGLRKQHRRRLRPKVLRRQIKRRRNSARKR